MVTVAKMRKRSDMSVSQNPGPIFTIWSKLAITSLRCSYNATSIAIAMSAMSAAMAEITPQMRANLASLLKENKIAKKVAKAAMVGNVSYMDCRRRREDTDQRDEQ